MKNKRKIGGFLFLVFYPLFIQEVHAESIDFINHFKYSIIFLDDVVCGGESVLQVIKFVMMLLDVIFFIVPIGLILMMMVDFAKNVIAGNVDEMKKNSRIALKRVIIAVALFLVPTIVQFSITLLGDLGVDYAECIEIATTEDLSKYKIEYDLDSTPNK